MPKPVITLVFTKCCGMNCFGRYFRHAQTCDNVRVQSPTEWTASVNTLQFKVRVEVELVAN